MAMKATPNQVVPLGIVVLLGLIFSVVQSSALLAVVSLGFAAAYFLGPFRRGGIERDDASAVAAAKA